MLSGLFIGTALLANPPPEARISDREKIERLELQLENTTDRSQQLDVLVELMRLVQGQDPAQELIYGTEALALLAVAPSPAHELEIYGIICLANYRQGRYQEAVESCERSIDLAVQFDNPSAQAKGVSRLGHTLRCLGDYHQALARANEAVVLFTQLDDHSGRGAALNSVGYAYRYLGELDQAIGHHLRALKVFEAVGDEAGIGKTLRNIGTLYKQTGLLGQALPVLESALAIQRRLDNHKELGKVLATLGTVHLGLGRREEGLNDLEEALRFREKAGDRTGIAIVLSKIGEAYQDSGQLERAQRYFERALLIHRETGERRREADTLTSLGTVLRGLDTPKQALELVNKAVEITTELDARQDLMQAYRELAETRAALGQEGAAIEAFRLYDRLKDEIMDDATMRSFAQAQSEIKEAYELSRVEPLDESSTAGEVVESDTSSTPRWPPWAIFATGLGLFGVGFLARGMLGDRGRGSAKIAEAEASAITGTHVQRELPAATPVPEAGPREVDGDAEIGLLLADEPSVAAALAGGSRKKTASQRFDEAQSQLIFPSDYFVGHSTSMTNLYQTMETLLGTEQTVMIEGETGVGKELVAQILHHSSTRRHEPFVPVNCAAIPSELLEAEMFGIDKGVATGVSQRQGWFRSAEGGTLFLDEIGEMPILLQAKLLRAVQEKRVHPVGGTEVAVDVWVIAATNQDLMNLINEGKFRSDLFYRLAGALLRVPPLRDRGEDLWGLAEHFLRQSFEREDWESRGISRKALDLLQLYDWPGNIRELQNEVRRLRSQVTDGQLIDSRMLSERIRKGAPDADSTATTASPQSARPEEAEAPADAPESLKMWDHVKHLEKKLILKALARAGQSRREASRLLGISRTTLLRKIREMDIGS